MLQGASCFKIQQNKFKNQLLKAFLRLLKTTYVRSLQESSRKRERKEWKRKRKKEERKFSKRERNVLYSVITKVDSKMV